MADSKRLNSSLLGELPSSVTVPAYARERISPGIVHLGLGNFHRSHQALYLDDLLHKQVASPWGLCGVGLLPGDSRMAEALQPQDCLYTLVERDGNTETARVIGSVCRYQHAPGDPEAVLERMADPATRIVSLTITEGGYYLDQDSGELEQDHPDLRHDLEHLLEAPVSVYGYLATALERRRRAGFAPFTVLSCDNLQGNGEIARRMLSSFAGLRDPQLGAWIEANVAFPNSMVDRITPATSDVFREQVETLLGGVQDAWPVLAERFIQWVIEDTFCNGRPAFEDLGVQLTTDVQPYELMKIRMLNASHQALCHLGVLLGYRTTDQAMRDPHIPLLLNRYMDAVRTLIPEPVGVDLADYQRTLLQRFANPAIEDQLARICQDASARIPKFVLPSARDQLRRDGPLEPFAFVVACWMRYLAGRDDDGNPIEVQDSMAELLRSKVKYADTDPLPFLNLRQVFGSDLPRSERFVAAVKTALEQLYVRGTRAALVDYATPLRAPGK